MDIALTITKEEIVRNVPVTVLHLRGWLDAQSEELLLVTAREAYDVGARFLLIDLAEVDTLTSAGMRALQKVYRLFTAKEEHFKIVRVRLCNAPLHVYNVLGITGFLHNIPNYETLQSALDAFEE